ncbi:hypothetical protein B0J12DRAFT_273348 [Macrophomina phaseolina]|uniref:Uncharacterized protein n=1 Tax=Macrophomina phaseolina TaxID=35725 RepID=A0ABQ8FXV5_9PEZI|nr:hypothetical protein B0J12DRAFT_273348 [Macrophomina phaseolina]
MVVLSLVWNMVTHCVSSLRGRFHPKASIAANLILCLLISWLATYIVRSAYADMDLSHVYADFWLSNVRSIYIAAPHLPSCAADQAEIKRRQGRRGLSLERKQLERVLWGSGCALALG